MLTSSGIVSLDELHAASCAKRAPGGGTGKLDDADGAKLLDVIDFCVETVRVRVADLMEPADVRLVEDDAEAGTALSRVNPYEATTDPPDEAGPTEIVAAALFCFVLYRAQTTSPSELPVI